MPRGEAGFGGLGQFHIWWVDTERAAHIKKAGPDSVPAGPCIIIPEAAAAE
jgi:hypothetical protein